MSEDNLSKWSMTREDLVKIINETEGLDRRAMIDCRSRWQTLCKPLNSLGELEEFIVLLAGIQRTAEPVIDRSVVVVFCADNGVVAEGVTQTTQEVTGTVARNMTQGLTTINAFARATNTDVIPVDVGIANFPPYDGVFDGKIMTNGTANFAKGPAMTEEEALAAMAVGIDRAKWAKEQGYQICVAGEMGIGNTTTSAAVLSCLLNEDPADTTGRGAGLDSVRLKHKVRVIRSALADLKPDPSDPIDVLAKVGGLDIAAMTGFYIGCARYRMPFILDGLISLTAAAIGVSIDPMLKYYMIASNVPLEPGAHYALKFLDVQGMFSLGLANGEGTAALLALPTLRMGLNAYNEVATFNAGGVEAYIPLN